MAEDQPDKAWDWELPAINSFGIQQAQNAKKYQRTKVYNDDLSGCQKVCAGAGYDLLRGHISEDESISAISVKEKFCRNIINRGVKFITIRHIQDTKDEDDFYVYYMICL